MKRILATLLALVVSIGAAHAQQIVRPKQGGTGVSQAASASTITLGGAVVFSGAFATTFSITGTTSVILPTAGTLATLAGAEELTTKTLNASVGKGTWTASGTWTLPAFTAGGLITSTTAGKWLNVAGATTGASYAQVANTSGDLYWTVESSGGGSVHTGVGAYESSIGTSVAKAMHIIVGNASAIKVGTASLTIANAQVTSAASGTRYLCIGTTGIVTSSAAVCAGT